MAVQTTFFQQLDERLSESQFERSRTATYLYNHYGEPSRLLTQHNAHWFNPVRRAQFSGFKNWAAFSDDATSLLLKPAVWSALAAYEVQKFWLSLAAALAQVIKLSPTGFVNKVVDMAEAFVASIVLTLFATLEFYMQFASLVMRTALTGLNAVGVQLPLSQDKEEDELDSDLGFTV